MDGVEWYRYCPSCGAEYRHEFTTCADCHVELQLKPPEAADRPQVPDGRIVELMRLPTRFDIDVIAAKLGAAGIPCRVDADDAGGWQPWVGQSQGHRLYVLESDLDDARAVLTVRDRAGPVRARRRPKRD